MECKESETVALAAWQEQWLAQVAGYARAYPHESAVVDIFCEFMRLHADAAQRELAHAHLTGSAWLVSHDGQRALLTHHRKLERWLQLGGHADGEVDLAQVALNEAREESGLVDLVVEAEIFDLDRHFIPARAEVAGHWHYDVRHVVRCMGSEAFAVSEESLDLAWRDIAGIVTDAGADDSLRRMARKWLDRMG